MNTAAWLTFLRPLIDIFLSAFGRSFNDWLAARRSEQAQREVGQLTVERDQAKEALEAQKRMTDAALNAPDRQAAIDLLEAGKA